MLPNLGCDRARRRIERRDLWFKFEIPNNRDHDLLHPPIDSFVLVFSTTIRHGDEALLIVITRHIALSNRLNYRPAVKRPRTSANALTSAINIAATDNDSDARTAISFRIDA